MDNIINIGMMIGPPKFEPLTLLLFLMPFFIVLYALLYVLTPCSFHPSSQRTSDNFGSMLCCCVNSENNKKYAELDAKLARKMVESRKIYPGHRSLKSMDSVIMKFPKLREGLRNIRSVFESYDNDKNGTIDIEELKKCLEELKLSLSDEEVKGLYGWCDVDGSKGIQFNEFVVLLCLIYLLSKPSSESSAESREMGPKLVESIFDPIVEVFLFLDKDGKGKLNKADVIKTLNNEDYPLERSPSHVTNMRFEEMDWGRKGKVGFREFLFAFMSWVGLDDADDHYMSISETT